MGDKVQVDGLPCLGCVWYLSRSCLWPTVVEDDPDEDFKSKIMKTLRLRVWHVLDLQWVLCHVSTSDIRSAHAPAQAHTSKATLLSYTERNTQTHHVFISCFVMHHNHSSFVCLRASVLIIWLVWQILILYRKTRTKIYSYVVKYQITAFHMLKVLPFNAADVLNTNIG